MSITVTSGGPVESGSGAGTNVGELTVLEIIQRACKKLEFDVPDIAVANTSREIVKLVHFSVETAEEMIRNANWPALGFAVTFTGDGTNTAASLPSGFDKFIPGTALINEDGNPVRGVSQSEWNMLTAVEGTPRYFHLDAAGDGINFWPYLPNGDTVTGTYQSRLWCSNGERSWTADSDTTRIPGEVVVLGTVARWKRYLGEDAADYLAEYEQAFTLEAATSDQVRR